MKRVCNNYWPLFVIIFIWVVFSSLGLFGGKIAFPGTYQVNNFSPWSAYPEFAGPVKNGAMPDIITQIYPWKHFSIETLKKGELPLWNPYSFSGTPHLANYQSAVLTPLNILFFILPFNNAWNILILLQPLLAGIFMYLFVRSLLVSKSGSLLSSISFMFCGFITVWMGYGTLGYAILYLPLALLALEQFAKTKKIKYLVLLSLTFPLSFFSGHFQISIYFSLFVLSYAIYTMWNIKNKSSAIRIFLFLIFGLLLTCPQVIPSIEFYLQSLRSTLFEKGEVIPWQYIPTLIAPDFYGNAVTRNDWFGHYAEWNGYLGMIPLVLGFYGATQFYSKKIFFFFCSGILAFCLAFQTPLLDILIALRLPVLSTSAVGRIIVLFSFSFAVLAGFGFDRLWIDIENKKIKKLLIVIGFFITAFILLWSIIFLKLFLPLDKILIAKSNLILPSLLFGGFIFICITAYLYTSQKVKIFLSFFLIFLIAFDMLRFTTKWIPFDPKSLVFPSIPTEKLFNQISGYQRVMANLGSEATVYYHLQSPEGYDALYIQRYGQFVASIYDGKLRDSYRSVVSFDKNGKYTFNVMNLLNMKYVIHKRSDDRMGWTFPFWTYPNGTFVPLAQDDKYEVFTNTKALPHAFLVNNYRVIKNYKKEIAALFTKNIDLSKTVILETDPKLKLKSSITGSSEIKSYSPTKIVINVKTNGNALLFISDNYYPGWEAFVGNKKTPIYRADYTFRAVPITTGSHVVRLEYHPQSFAVGLSLATLSIMAILVSIVLF